MQAVRACRGVQVHLHSLSTSVLDDTCEHTCNWSICCSCNEINCLYGAEFLERSVLRIVKKFPTFYGIRRFIITIIKSRHLYLPWDRSVQSTFSQPVSLRSIWMLSSHLRWGLTSVSFLQVSVTETQDAPLLAAIHATFPAHLVFFSVDNLDNIWWEYKLWRFPLRQHS